MSFAPPVRVAIHQPNFLPWLGFWSKMAASDVFILLDQVQFSKRFFTNRVRIKSQAGEAWLTVPVQSKSKYDQRINQVRYSDTLWRNKHLKTLNRLYARAPFYETVFPVIEELYAFKSDLLFEWNYYLIAELKSRLQLGSVELKTESLLPAGGEKSDRLLSLVKSVNGTVYLCGKGGSRDYLDVERFIAEGITVEFHTFHHPVYPQRFGEFLPKLSILDCLFNCGWEETRRLITVSTGKGN